MTLSAEKVPFVALCRVLEGVQQKKPIPEKKAILSKFIKEWREKSFDGTNGEDSFYPFLRCITPQLEKIAYGLKEPTLGRLYIEVMGLGKGSDAANRLLNYKKPIASSITHKLIGDFAECAYDVIKDRCSTNCSLTVMDVINKLNDLANGYTNSDRKLVRTTLEHLIRNLTGLENKWFIRMLVKDMKLGLGQDSILTLFHPDASALFSVDTNLQRICTTLRDPNKRLHEIEVSLFAPLKPMLGRQAKPNEAEHLFRGSQFLMERKFDGERMQLHMKDGQYKYFSRNGHEFTSTYGADRFSGNLTSKLERRFRGVNSCILDGEMCGWDEELQVLGTKAMNFDIKSSNIQRYTPCYIVFDVLYLNDEVLTNKPLKERLEKLKTIIDPQEGVVTVSELSTASSNAQCIEALNLAIERYEEGIMIKDPQSVYKPNSRTAGWYKVKPEYVDGLMDELDIIIIGGYFGKGRRSNIVSHFLCAVMDEKSSLPKFVSMTKVGSGYSWKELLDFNMKLKAKWTKNKPENVHVSKEKPDVYIDPLQSAILQVKATEITETSAFGTGYTLRFPRVMKIRDDKAPLDCLTLSEFNSMRTARQGQLAGSNLLSLLDDDVSDAPPTKKSRRGVHRHVITPAVADQFKAGDVSSVNKEGDVFDGKEFCVVNSTPVWSKQKLEREIAKLGGNCVQNPGLETYCIVASSMNLRAKNCAKSNKYNVLKADWLIRCIQQTALLDWQPSDIWAASKTMQETLKADFDEFGDGFFKNTSQERLKQVFCLMPSNKTGLTKQEIHDVETEHMLETPTNLSLFRGLRLFRMIDGSKSATEVDLALASARFYGAVVSEKLEDSVTHFIGFDCPQEVNDINRARVRKLHMVRPAWILNSIKEGKLEEERDYAP